MRPLRLPIAICFIVVAVFVAGALFGREIFRSKTVSLERDPYEGWETVEFEGVISMRIAPGCLRALDASHIICPTEENDQPLPEMTVRMVDGVLEIRRWEGLSSVYWDQMIASIRLLAPLKQDVQIFIEK